jgi:hypothetical protein
MKTRNLLIALVACSEIFVSACSHSQKGTSPTAVNQGAAATAGQGAPAALPDNGFKAIITVAEPPAKLRSGQKQTIQVKVKNASDVLWYARGAAINTAPTNKFYLAVGNRWLAAADGKLVTDMDGRFGVDRDLKPGEETEVPLAITAPNTPGEYTLEVDLVQEQVAWFHDKGSTPARVRITVER